MSPSSGAQASQAARLAPLPRTVSPGLMAGPFPPSRPHLNAPAGRGRLSALSTRLPSLLPSPHLSLTTQRSRLRSCLSARTREGQGRAAETSVCHTCLGHSARPMALAQHVSEALHHRGQAHGARSADMGERTEKGKGSRGAAGRSGCVARGSRALRHRGTGPRDCPPVTLVFSLWERALTCLNPQTVQDTGCFIHASAKPKTDSTEVPRTSPLKRRRACTLSSLCAACSVPCPGPRHTTPRQPRRDPGAAPAWASTLPRGRSVRVTHVPLALWVLGATSRKDVFQRFPRDVRDSHKLRSLRLHELPAASAEEAGTLLGLITSEHRGIITRTPATHHADRSGRVVSPPRFTCRSCHPRTLAGDHVGDAVSAE